MREKGRQEQAAQEGNLVVGNELLARKGMGGSFPLGGHREETAHPEALGASHAASAEVIDAS